LFYKSECKSKKNGTAPEIEVKWVPGGKDGTRAWRRISAVHKIQSGKNLGKVKSFFKELQSNCKHKLKNGICNSKENPNNECNATICPLIIRR
jgi:hypothetical protein